MIIVIWTYDNNCMVKMLILPIPAVIVTKIHPSEFVLPSPHFTRIQHQIHMSSCY